MFVFCFWYAIIGFVAFAILHIIFARGLKGKVIPSLLTYLGTTAVAIAILFGFSFGIGIDVYVPSPVTVKSVQFDGMDFKDPENILIRAMIKERGIFIRQYQDMPVISFEQILVLKVIGT